MIGLPIQSGVYPVPVRTGPIFRRLKLGSLLEKLATDGGTESARVTLGYKDRNSKKNVLVDISDPGVLVRSNGRDFPRVTSLLDDLRYSGFSHHLEGTCRSSS
ncbi:hypothetical protein CTAM01_16173 [Colletotrichum tamarilloi]|uniref:Uncharacterized protein n=1 Tax=Colletotrichum tamarilloi TaxID=1209934 RepID=A0ABQ9QJC3_9PEZI|nr:uncharacterized protein CTAM01_16173 [Colletotrichum tamarilloi]KAK1473219.1 hypothetical protein CTAM01_16173 [Colletotrichum tamarilloi]